MATLRVRYRTGDTDEWELHDQLDLTGFFRALMNTGRTPGSQLNFGIQARSGEAWAFGTAWIRMDDVVMWEMDGMVDIEQIAATWPAEQD